MPRIVRSVSTTTEGYVHRIERSVTFAGDLSEEQHTRLQEIAHKCPVHKTLTSPIVIAGFEGLISLV